MTFFLWMLVLGSILLIVGLASAYVRLLPISTSALYLLFGLFIGPAGLGLWGEDVLTVGPWLEHLVEATVLISLFLSGLRLRLPFRAPEWRPAGLLAGPVLVATILGLAVFLHFALDLSPGLSLLLAAILSPTDPVLANLIQVNDAGDTDPMRFALTGEAGLNDGIAFPFVMAGLMLLAFETPANVPTEEALIWLLRYVLWAIPAGLLLGFWFGRLVGQLGIHLRARHTDMAVSPNTFLALAVIALSYVATESIGAWGFLGTFAAGLGMRQAEVGTSGAVPAEECTLGAENREPSHGQAIIEFGDDKERHPQIAASALMVDILAFGNLLERALEVLLVTLLGALLYAHWRWEAVIVAIGLFLLVRPAAVMLFIHAPRIPPPHRLLIGWFGIRGIGSLFYLCFVLNEGPAGLERRLLSDMVLSVVAMSILIHGVTVQPLLRYHKE
ncbi:sodium:proton antiporter [Pseudomonas taiwanensis]|uniref:cation:proton antiporter n=1 Tax=Pseudomonas taiwanensis TaxID=470150 RepID=UPI0015BA6905|nr:cation:proton antiporter [Pseudomonas taiwanensis]NWL76460.1 sodium:proton antiporter [Pseudomonas taiwanensis]